MLKFYDLAQASSAGPTYVTIGNFDGIHRGHQSLLQQLRSLAQQHQTRAQLSKPISTALVTFDPHPLAVLRPEQPLLLLTTPHERLELAAALGIDIGVIQPFTPAVAALTAQAFMSWLKERLNLVGLVVGPDFALGRNRTGNVETLQALGQELGYRVHVIEPQDWQGEPVRSSIIRQAVQQGDVVTAAERLGRPYHVSGLVVIGDQRGRQIGVPTANLQAPPDKLTPANGVYATRVLLTRDGATASYQGATNIGVRPTVDGLHHRIETHLLDFPPPGMSGDLYGQPLRLEFMARLRGEERFASLAALVAQIQQDVAQARQVLHSIT